MMVTDHEMRMEALRLFEENERLMRALMDLYAVARVDRDEDYAAVTNAANLIEQLAGIHGPVGTVGKT